jgi:hypothetical protein
VVRVPNDIVNVLGRSPADAHRVTAVTIKAMTMKSRTEEMMSCHVLAGVSAKAGPFPVMWLTLLSRNCGCSGQSITAFGESRIPGFIEFYAGLIAVIAGCHPFG